MISSMGEKDTVRNLRDTGAFVVCGSPESMIEEINLTSVEFPHGVSEFDRIGVSREPSARVAPPRVAESPYALECRRIDIRHVGNGILVLGEVIHIAVRDDVFDGPVVDVTRLDLVARLGGSQWSRLGEIIEIPRVTLEEFDSLNRP
jgi:flavin reductase (DIM6/NTAB) family NADH-FMN oxidoreductase RutF